MTEFSTLARGIQRLWWLIAALGLLGGSAAVAANTLMTPVYQAKTSILVGETLDGSEVDTRALEASNQVAQSYADIIPRRPVMEAVVETVDLPITWQELARRVQVDLPDEDPQLIVVTVEATSSREAQAIAGAVGDQLLAFSSSRAATEEQKFVAGQLTALRQKIEATDKRIADLQKQRDAATTPESRQSLRDQIDDQEKMLQDWQKNYAGLATLKPPDSASTSVEILEKAHASPRPVSPRTNQNVLLSVTLGLLLAIPITYILENRRASDEEAGRQARSASEAPTAAVHEPRGPGDRRAAGVHVNSHHERESPRSTREIDGLAGEVERPSQEHDSRSVGTSSDQKSAPKTQPAPPLTVAPDTSPSVEERT